MTYIQTAGKKAVRFVSALFLAALLLAGPAVAVRGVAPAKALRPLATAAFPKERAALQSPERRANFPRLGSDFQVLAPSTGGPRYPGAYNCIAWSLGNTHEWVWPGESVADFDALYGKYGYTRQPGLNLAVEPGKRKVVLFATLNPDGTIKAATHAAVQEADGTWTSKLGGMALIRHP